MLLVQRTTSSEGDAKAHKFCIHIRRGDFVALGRSATPGYIRAAPKQVIARLNTSQDVSAVLLGFDKPFMKSIKFDDDIWVRTFWALNTEHCIVSKSAAHARQNLRHSGNAGCWGDVFCNLFLRFTLDLFFDVHLRVLDRLYDASTRRTSREYGSNGKRLHK